MEELVKTAEKVKKSRSKKKLKISQIIVIIAVGFMLALFAGMYRIGVWKIAEDGEENCVYRMYDSQMRYEGIEQHGVEYYVVAEYPKIYLSPKYGGFEYRFIEVRIISDDVYADAKLVCYNAEDNVLKEQKINLNGKTRKIELDDGWKYCCVEIDASVDSKISLIKVEYRTQSSIDNMWDFWSIFFKVYLVYSCITILLYCFCRKHNIKINYYFLVDGLVRFYLTTRNALVYVKVMQKNKTELIFLRDISIIVGLTLMAFTIYWNEFNYHYSAYVLVSTCTIFAVTLLWSRKNNKLKKVNMHNPLALSFVIFSIMAIISEIYVHQRFSWVGAFNLFVLGFFGFVIGSGSNANRLFEYFRWVVIFVFLYCVWICFYGEAHMLTMGSFAGIYNNANAFGLYLLSVSAVLIASVERDVYRQRLSLMYIMESLLLGIAICLILKTNCRAAIAGLELMLLLLGSKLFMQCRNSKKLWKFILQICLLMTSIIFAYKMSIWIINNNSLKDSNIKLSSIMMTPAEVYGADISEKMKEIRKNFSWNQMDKMLSGRVQIWSHYARNFNLMGHAVDYSYIPGSDNAIETHNMFIAKMYQYGIFSIIPYIAMWIYVLRCGLIYCYDKKSSENYSIMPINLVIVFFCSSVVDTMEDRPFHNMAWYMFYMLIGYFMVRYPRKNTSKHSVKKSLCKNIQQDNKKKLLYIIAIMVYLLFFLVLDYVLCYGKGADGTKGLAILKLCVIMNTLYIFMRSH